MDREVELMGFVSARRRALPGGVPEDSRRVGPCVFAGMTAQIAAELGIPEGTVKSRWPGAGRERLAPMLDEREESDHV